MFSRPQTWVKNVYSLCVEGVVTRAQSYTAYIYTQLEAAALRVKPSLFTSFLNSFTPYVYTPLFTSLPLVNSHLYTVSTAPTIKKKKENKKGN